MTDFEQTIATTYKFDVPSVEIGVAIREGKIFPNLPIKIPLSVLNRHGLIAGSTGTGKTRTLQLMAESLSRQGVPTFLADVKGDLAGMSAPGAGTPKITERAASMGRTFTPEAFPVEFLSLTGTHGTQVRATISSFGPILLGKVLDLTEAQQSVLAMVFKYCDDQRLPLLDFQDLRDVLGYLSDEGKAELKEYGVMSPQTVGVLVRKMVELEQQGAAAFFGEPELDINDLLRTDANGRGVVHILSLADVQDKPRLYSTFLMWLLGQFYYTLPEIGDPEKPKLVFFFDEAHQLFDDASSALVEHIEQVARLIRSKGIGVFFITQTPKDIGEDVLAQLGNRIQHAVRAFTPQDAKNLRAAASTFPKSEFYSIDKTLTSLGIGEALVTVLNPKGVPTESSAVQILPPSSSMTSIDESAYSRMVSASSLNRKYATAVDRESAHEILAQKIASSAGEEAPQPAKTRAKPARKEKTVLEQVFNNTVTRQMGRQAARTVTTQVIRGIFGLLKGR
ncbi:MAG TPA: helicase HerA-like domain-containing protein [Thermoanaerobaculia bacterium]|nr:helicase HerA-like domain-containing protein [Thermoanaerobaculia bacterium]